MNTKTKFFAAAALCICGGVAYAQDDLKGIEPVIPVGPAVVPVKPVGPAMTPVVPVESLRAVETVTLKTENGPVVVISHPNYAVPDSEHNIDFSALDSNNDGYVSKEESTTMSSRNKAAKNLDAEFKVADKNGDARLALTEIIDWIY